LSEVSFGAWKMGDKVENDYTISITRFTLTMGDEEIYHIDSVNGVFRVYGSDQYADDRANLGF